MSTRTRLIGGVLAVVMTLGTLAAPVAASASERGQRDTTYALGAASLLLLLSHKPGAALVAAGATGVAASEWQRSIDKRHKRENWWRYRREGDRNDSWRHDQRDRDDGGRNDRHDRG